MTASTVALVGAICHRHRELLPLLDEHLQDNDGELSPHLLLSDVVRWLSALKDDEGRCQQIWTWLENAYADGDDDEKDLVAVSGVEMIPDPGLPGSGMRSMLGPSLRGVDPWLG